MDVERVEMPNRPSTAPAWRRDILASVVVFLVALPLCLGIAIASGMPVASGLLTGIIGGLVVGFLAGSPLQVSGPAAGLTVIVLAFVQQHGHEVLGPMVLIGGGLQVLAGLFSLGPWFRAVSPAVIKGMLSGIGVLILTGQLHVMVDDAPKKDGIENIVTIPEAVRKGLPLPEWKPADERRFRSDLLKKVARLHETQEEIADEVHASVSDHSTPAEAAAQAAELSRLQERQAQVAKDLSAVTAELEAWRGDAADAAARHEAAELARQNVHAALTDLNESVEKGTISKTQDEAGRVSADVRVSQNEALTALDGLTVQIKAHDWAAKIGVATILIIVFWQSFAPTVFRLIPAQLVAVVAVTAFCAAAILPVRTIELPERLADGIHLVSWTVFKDVPLSTILQGAFVIAIVASAETLLCATAVDQLHNGPRTNYDRELVAQGIGNSLCGFLGGLPMTGVIVRSATNIQAGAQTRLSAILHGVWLLLAVALFSSVLQRVPTACLAGILVYTGWKLVDIKGFVALAKYSRGEAAIFLTTLVMIVATDLLTGVLSGIALAGLKLLYTFSHLAVRLDVAEDRQSAKLHLEGAATFIRLPRLASVLESVPRGAELHVQFEELTYIDHACLDLLMSWARQHEASGGRLVVDWDSLHATFRKGPALPSSRNGANGNGQHHAKGRSTEPATAGARY